ncbi:hypothetical protein L2E82_12222 [Cichorium intybus]|uniref:Uncharacterized protein n=1 Tax=Cichorium intybus TaxID=13427 RepID=A0ACB9GHG8_CICIN|nr:hypothetical protein L2E82_12222 [Cichorium intybus]
MWVYGYRRVKTSLKMSKGSENSGSSAPRAMANFAYVGPISTVQAKTTVGGGSYENKSRVSFGDKQTGSYGRATATEKASAGEFEWKNGKSGTRNEYKETATLRIGDKSGYTEVYNEQRIRNVSFNNTSGSKNIITYNNGNGGQYGGYGYEYGYDSD